MGEVDVSSMAFDQPSDVRYIKLGRKGKWEEECLDSGTLRLGYGNPHHERALAGDWETLKKYYGEVRSDAGAATRDVNQIRQFYELPETCLWITFHARQLFWTFAKEEVVEVKPGGDRIRHTLGGWRSETLDGTQLTIQALDGRVSQVQAFRGTICAVQQEDYLVRKIRGEMQPEVVKAWGCYAALKSSLEDLIRGLWWHDFELLTDLVFSQGGWQRVAVVGKTEKDIDLDLLSPITGRKAFVQVKSKAGSETLRGSVEKFRGWRHYDEFYFVVHSPAADLTASEIPGVNVIDVARMADLVIRAGLVDWLIAKRS